MARIGPSIPRGLSFVIEFSLIEIQNRSGLAVMVVMVAVPMVVMIIVVIAMVFAVPVAFMNSPTFAVVVVVGMAPVGAGVGWPLPTAGNPDVAATARAPVPIDPGVAFFRHGRSDFIADRRRRGADIDLDLAECRNC
jgi:hypothetical protein